MKLTHHLSMPVPTGDRYPSLPQLVSAIFDALNPNPEIGWLGFPWRFHEQRCAPGLLIDEFRIYWMSQALRVDGHQLVFRLWKGWPRRHKGGQPAL